MKKFILFLTLLSFSFSPTKRIEAAPSTLIIGGGIVLGVVGLAGAILGDIKEKKYREYLTTLRKYEKLKKLEYEELALTEDEIETKKFLEDELKEIFSKIFDKRKVALDRNLYKANVKLNQKINFWKPLAPLGVTLSMLGAVIFLVGLEKRSKEKERKKKEEEKKEREEEKRKKKEELEKVKKVSADKIKEYIELFTKLLQEGKIDKVWLDYDFTYKASPKDILEFKESHKKALRAWKKYCKKAKENRPKYLI